MKYCSKCGNPMKDDMIFCQKCGTKFEGMVINQNDIEEKLAKMKKYNLVIDAQTISWDYLSEDGERAGNISVKQDKLCQELSELIKEILEGVSDADRDLVEREVYTYVLQMGCKMCKEAEKLFASYAGFKELFDKGNTLVRMGQLDAATFLEQMSKSDYVYKAVAGLQGLHSSRIKEVLDEDVIYNNNEYRDMTKQLAQAFNNMWVKCVKRYTDFFLSPGEDFINSTWDIYNVLLKGLPISVIDTLDESGWELVLKDREKNHNGWQFKQSFIKKRDQQRDVKRKEEREIEDKKYWDTHPNEYNKFEENKKRIVEINAKVNEVDEEISSMENCKQPLVFKSIEIKKKISDKKKKVDKLGRKIFGKKKAGEEIVFINGRVIELTKELQIIYEKIKIAEKPISEKNIEKSKLEREIQCLEQENIELRYKKKEE